MILKKYKSTGFSKRYVHVSGKVREVSLEKRKNEIVSITVHKTEADFSQ